MQLTSDSFSHEAPIPDEFALGRPHPTDHFTLSSNRNPHLAWSGVPGGTRSFALICVDTEAPTVADDVNQEGRSVSADLSRADFHHWTMVDIPATVSSIEAGECSAGVTAGGTQDPPGPTGCRQGINDYTGWFAGDADMAGTYRGYDGPGPPWNDERLHRYEFHLYALDVDQAPVEGDFGAADVQSAIDGHVLAEATLTGTYTLNPDLR